MPMNAEAQILQQRIFKELSKLPKELNLIYVEWNEGWPKLSDYRNGKPKQMCYSLFAYARNDSEPFDPEDPEDEDILADPLIEKQAGAISVDAFKEEDEYEFFQTILSATPNLADVLENRTMAFGRHEGAVKVFRTQGRKKSNDKAGQYYYELHPKSGPSEVESFEIGEFDETPLQEHDLVPNWPKKGIQLILKNARKRPDCIYFYRGWLICSERLTQMLQSATKSIQTFPAPLFQNGNDGLEPVDGYFVVNLYEKLDCLHEEDVLPSAWKGGPKTFDAGKGYRIKRSAVKGKQVFRINYEYFRLLVSQDLRDQLEQAKITGIEWLRRNSVE